MEANQGSQARKRELRTVSFFVAVIVALMGFSAALANKPAQPEETAPQAQADAATYENPALHGLSVAADAQPDFDPGRMYY